MTMIKHIIRLAAVAAIAATISCCHKHTPDEPDYENRRVLLFYACGFNNLNTDIKSDLDKELMEGSFPDKNGDVVLVYSRIAGRDYTPVKSYVRRLYKSKGKIISDTLKTYSETTVAADPTTLRTVLEYVREEFPAKGYGMVFSSHGSGWLPAGYYSNPSSFERDHRLKTDSGSAILPASVSSEDTARLPVPDGDLADIDPWHGMVRSLGYDEIEGKYYGYEMTVSDLAGAIPYHLDYLLFDMCFTAGVEVLYGLKDVADYIGASPTEVLADGYFDYSKITGFLLGGSSPDLVGLYKDSFDRYNRQTDETYRSVTLNLVKTRELENLAEVCRKLISTYRDGIDDAPTDDIQGYFRYMSSGTRHYFYDLEDIFVKCGAADSDLKELRSAMNGCVVYKNATPKFISLKIDTFSGFSMYLPKAGTPLLDSYYRDEPWNKATGLVQ